MDLMSPFQKLVGERLYLELKTGAWQVTLFSDRDGKWYQPSTRTEKALFARFPERSRVKYGIWRLRPTDFTALILHHCWPVEDLLFADDDSRFSYLEVLMRFQQQSQIARDIAEYKLNGNLPTMPEGYGDHPDLPLMPHQTLAAACAIRADGFGMFMEQGTGKTPSAVRVAMHGAEHCDEAYRVLVACPKAVKLNWQREIQRFATIGGTAQILDGTRFARIEQVAHAMTPEDGKPLRVVIGSYGTVVRTWEGAMDRVPWDLVIADESHMIKDPSTARSKCFMDIRDCASKRIALTGTPVGNNIMDLYAQLEFLGHGYSGFVSHKVFKNFHGQYQLIGDGVEKLVGAQQVPLLKERLSRTSVFFPKKEVLPDLPEKVYDVLEVEMTKEQHRVYKELQNVLFAEIESTLGEGGTITIQNALTKMLRLAQVSSGYATVDEEYDEQGDAVSQDRVRRFEGNPKLAVIREVLSEKGPKDKTIIWCCFIPFLLDIVELVTELGLPVVSYYGATSDQDRKHAEDFFNQHDGPVVFVGNPAAGGAGLNLPGYVPGDPEDHGCNADHVIFAASNWSWLQRSQAEDRNHGKDRCRVPIRYTDLLAARSVEHKIRDAVSEKRKTSLEVQDLQSIMESLKAWS